MRPGGNYGGQMLTSAEIAEILKVRADQVYRFLRKHKTEELDGHVFRDPNKFHGRTYLCPDGKQRTVRAISVALGVADTCIRRRLKRGESLKDIYTRYQKEASK